MEMASSRRNLKKNNNNRLGPDRSTDEMQLEYDKWKNTAISILHDMKEGSARTAGRHKYRKSNYRNEKGHLENLTVMQSEALALKKLLEQRPTNVKKQGHLCAKHSKSLRHKVTKVKLDINDNASDENVKYDKSNSYGIQYTRNDYARQIVFGRLPRDACTYRKCKQGNCCSRWTVNAGIGGEPGQFSIFDITILLIIIVNTVVLFLESQDIYHNNDSRNNIYPILHTIFLILFTIEALLKMSALGEKENFFCRLGIDAYFRSRWNKFDFLILVLGWIGTASDVTHTRTTTTLRVFRLFRAIRAFRLFSAIKIIIDAVVYGTRYIFFMVFLFYCGVYLFSLVGQSLFHNAMRSICLEPMVLNNITELKPAALNPPYRCVGDCATVDQPYESCPTSELRFIGGVQCSQYDPNWVCGIGVRDANYNYDNFDNIWEAFKTASTFMFQRTWKTEYDSLVESRSALLAFTYYFFLIMVRLLTDLFITSILCVVLTNVRDAHFKKTGIVTTHYKKLKLKASFRQNMLKDKNQRLSDSSVPTQSSSSSSGSSTTTTNNRLVTISEDLDENNNEDNDMEQTGEETDELLDDYDKAKAYFQLPKLEWRVFVRENIVLTRTFEYFIYLIIITNAITMAVLAKDNDLQEIAFVFRLVFALIYLIEVVLKMSAFGTYGYFQINRFNWLDFFVAISGLIYIILEINPNNPEETNEVFLLFQTFRLIRILRIVRLVKAFPTIWETSQVILDSYYMILLLAIFIIMTNLIFAIFMTAIAGETMLPGNPCSEGNGVYAFKNLYQSLLTLFVSFVASGWQKLRILCRNELFVTVTMLFYVAVVSNVLSRIAIAVVVSNFEASDHERQEFNKHRFKAVTEIQNLARKLTRCTATIRLSYLHSKVVGGNSVNIKRKHTSSKTKNTSINNNNSPITILSHENANNSKIRTKMSGDLRGRSRSIGGFENKLAKSLSGGVPDTKKNNRWNSNNKKKSSAVAIPMKRDKIEDAYTEHLDDIINLLYEIKTRTIDSEGAIPTDTMRSLREIIRDTLKDHICPRLLQGRVRKSPLMKGLIDQVLYFLPEFTAKFGKSQLEHCMKLTELLINLVQLQIVTPNLLREVDVQNNQYVKTLIDGLRNLGIASLTKSKNMMSSSLLKSEKILNNNIRSSLASSTDAINDSNNMGSNDDNNNNKTTANFKSSISTSNNKGMKKKPCMQRILGVEIARSTNSCVSRITAITILLCIILYMFALVGYMLLYQRVGKCVMHSHIKSKISCDALMPQLMPNSTKNTSHFRMIKWIPNPDINFDTFGSSFLVTFDLLALNNVENVMEGIQNVNIWFVLFPAFIILVLPLFLIHLFSGVMVMEVSRAFGTFLLTSEQRMWVNKQREINGISPIVTFTAPPRNNSFRLFFYKLIIRPNRSGFKHWVVYTIRIIILAHNITSIFILGEKGFDYEHTSLWIFDITVFCIYSIELTIKYIAIGKNNFRSISFCISFFLMLMTIGSYIIQKAIIGEITTFPTVFLRFRIVVLLRDLIYEVKSLQVIYRTFKLSLPGIFNVFVIPYIIITLLFWLIGLQLLSNQLHWFDVLVLLFRIFSGGDFSRDMRIDYGNGAGGMIYIIIYFFLSRCILLNALFAVVLDNFKTVYQESRDLIPLAGWEIYFFKRIWFQYDPDGRGKIPAKNLKSFIDVFASEVYKKKDGELMSRKIQLLHSLKEKDATTEQSGQDVNDIDLVHTDEIWKRSFVLQLIQESSTMEPEKSFSKIQLQSSDIIDKLSNSAVFRLSYDVDRYTNDASLTRQSISEFHDIMHEPLTDLSRNATYNGDIDLDQNFKENTPSQKKMIKAVSFHTVLRELMQNRLMSHFTKLREDLRIELMAETSEKGNGCVVCLTQAKTEKDVLAISRIAPNHAFIFKDLLIKCAIRYVYLIRLKNKLKQKVLDRKNKRKQQNRNSWRG